MGLGDLMKALGESANEEQPAGNQQGADALSQLLGSLLGGGAAGGQGSADMTSMLGALLGGAASPGAQPSAGSDVLAALGGGNAPQGGGDIGSMLGALLGGGAGQGSAMGVNPILAPIVEGLAQKLGLPPEIAGAVVTFALTKLFGGMMGGAGKQGSLDLGNTLIQSLQSGEGLDAKSLNKLGLTQELAQQTGLDQSTAANSLQHVFGVLGNAMGSGQ